jgi:hypothetical protein
VESEGSGLYGRIYDFPIVETKAAQRMSGLKIHDTIPSKGKETLLCFGPDFKINSHQVTPNSSDVAFERLRAQSLCAPSILSSSKKTGGQVQELETI